jgi:uncharacterized protein (DUF1810 family)
LQQVWEKPMRNSDPFNLGRFLVAQSRFYAKAMRELQAGRKHGHWMWFIFPQLRGLGRSESSRFYGLASLKEAETYLGHPILGPRLQEITEVVTGLKKRKLEDIFAHPDERQFHSCMTLFAIAGDDTRVFDNALIKYFKSELDPDTRDLLRTPNKSKRVPKNPTLTDGPAGRELDRKS